MRKYINYMNYTFFFEQPRNVKMGHIQGFVVMSESVKCTCINSSFLERLTKFLPD